MRAAQPVSSEVRFRVANAKGRIKDAMKASEKALGGFDPLQWECAGALLKDAARACKSVVYRLRAEAQAIDDSEAGVGEEQGND